MTLGLQTRRGGDDGGPNMGVAGYLKTNFGGKE